MKQQITQEHKTEIYEPDYYCRVCEEVVPHFAIKSNLMGKHDSTKELCWPCYRNSMNREFAVELDNPKTDES